MNNLNLPQRISQHKSESDSFAILLYKLKDLGIFRNFTQNDYGIDLEVELLEKTNVIGKYFKAQVKSSIDLKPRKDGVLTTNGIKQSTLNYWAELSFHSPVIAFAVDVNSEDLYITKPLFWQALSLLDNSNQSKSIEYYDKNKTPQDLNELIKLITKFATQPSIHEQVFAHKLFMQNLNRILESYIDCVYSDIGSEITVGSGAFKTFLQSSRILLHELELIPRTELKMLSDMYQSDSKFHRIRNFQTNDIENIFNFQHYLDISDHSEPDINSKDGLMAFNVLFPKILTKLNELKTIVMNSEEFWKRRDPEYFDMVKRIDFPKEYSLDEMQNFQEKRNNQES